MTYLTVPGSAWKLAATEFNGEAGLAFAAYQGHVGVLSPTSGKTWWTAPLGGFPNALATADLDGDGRDEILAAAADGVLSCFGSDGKARWSYQVNAAALMSLAVIRGKDGPPRVACGGFGRTIELLDQQGKLLARLPQRSLVNHLVAADVDGDGDDELLAVIERDDYLLFDVDAKGLRQRWRKRIRATEDANARPFQTYSAAAGDLDGDGRDEIVLAASYGGQFRVLVVDGEGQPRWVTKPLPGPNTGGFERGQMFMQTVVQVGQADPTTPGLEVLAATSGSVRIFRGDGSLLGEAHAPVGFLDLTVVDGYLCLGSTPGGDDTVYHVPLAGWPAAVKQLRRHGLAATIGQTLATMRRQAQQQPLAAIEPGRYQIRLNSYDHRQAPAAPGTLQGFREDYPYPAIAPIAQCGSLSNSLSELFFLDSAGQPTARKRPAADARTPEQLTAWARQLEASGIPTDLHFDHGCTPKLSVDSVRRLVAASPTALRGFMSHEDEQFDKLPTYAAEYLAPVAAICQEADKTLYLQEKNVWWFAAPAIPEIFDALFRDGRGTAIAAGCDNANSRTPELNLMARLGLKQAGLIGHIQMSAINDLYSWNRVREYEDVKQGHPLLRLFVAGTVLGADRYYVRMDNYYQDHFVASTDEGVGLFLELLARGLVFAPRPEQMAGLSPVGIAVHAPSQDWITFNSLGHDLKGWDAHPDMQDAVIPPSSVAWGMTPTPPHALQAVLLHKRRQFGYHVPPTPYGPFVIVPARADLTKVPGVDSWWHTDGVAIWCEGGARLTGEQAATALRESFEAAAAKLPFRAVGDDVFCQTLRLDDGRYRLYLIDPGWEDPADRQVEVLIQRPGRHAVTDLLSGEAVAANADRFAITVPAGALRILEVVGG